MFRPKAKFEKQDSTVYLDPQGNTGSSCSAATPRPTSPLSDFGHHKSPRTPTAMSPCAAAFPSPTPFSVAVAIRRGRVLLVTTLAVGLILVLVYTFNHGVELTRFDSSTKNSVAREKLLDDYNSYSGNVASAFGKPIEILVTVLVQIITLRFMASAVTQSTTSWKLWPTTLLASASVGYLISNAFNAVNVQLRPQEIEAMISANDLSLTAQLNQDVVGRTTSVLHTVSELSPRNLITNTVLRNTVLPRVTLKQELCDWEQTRLENERGGEMPFPTIDYGFTQRDWQSRVLQEALPPQTLRVVVNPTSASANENLQAVDLPMNASRAADLFLYGMSIAPRLFPWGYYGDYVDTADLGRRYPESTSPDDSPKRKMEPTARIVGLLPPQVNDETSQRLWFVRESQAALRRQFRESNITSRKDIVMTFSHVDISPHITFDALTFEVEMDPLLLATARTRDNATMYTQVSQAADPGNLQDCGPWPAMCLVKKPLYQPPSRNPFALDALQNVHAFGACVNPTGGDDLHSAASHIFKCENASSSAMMVYSVGKRLMADAITQNLSDGVSSRTGAEPAVIKNLRKVYTFTIGRLQWKLQNLSKAFNAQCAAGVTCQGLQLPLESQSLGADGTLDKSASTNASSPNVAQHLVVSANALPVDLLVPSTRLYHLKPRSVPLVEVSESPYESIMTGDVLMPHNSGKITWDNRTVTKACNADIEALLFTKINNHIYIEHGFQTAYTAATFFLFQNAVVKDTVQLSTSRATLAFELNKQDMVVWMSTPQQNAYLTLAGCVLLVLGLSAALIKAAGLASKQHDDPLSTITAPQAIARVMLDDQQFPAMLLHRRVVDASKTNVEYRKLEQFTITELTVQHQEDRDRLTAME